MIDISRREFGIKLGILLGIRIWIAFRLIFCMFLLEQKTQWLPCNLRFLNVNHLPQLSNSLIPRPSPWENHFRPLFEGLKSSSRVPARTWGYIIFNSNISGDKAATKHFYIVFFRDQSPLLWTPPLWLMVSSRSQPFPQWFAKVSTITMIIFIGWDWLSRNLWLTIPILTHILRSNSTILIHFLELRS